ncbi:MAG TPA: EAL domain-containing protein [Solirubrobacteraceae bacterium]
MWRRDARLVPTPVVAGAHDPARPGIVRVSTGAREAPTRLADALVRMAEAEDALRAIAAGEVDGFVVSDRESGQRVFTLSTADRPYRMFVENMREGAATLSSTGIILYANRRLAELLSCPREAVVGSPLSTFLPAGTWTGLARAIRGPGGTTLEFDLLNGDGVLVPVLVGSSPLVVEGDRFTCVTFADLTAQKAQGREIARLSHAQAERLTDLQDAQVALTAQATHDALTGLPNRALLVDRIDQALALATRSDRCIAVLFVDLDHFKLVNDTHGHAAGDRLLRHVAQRLVGSLRPMDTVARIGGDEFVVLAPEVGSELDAVDLSARLICDMDDKIEASSADARVLLSIGISYSIAGRGTAETLLKEADTAMYQAKSLGGGRAQVFDAALGRRVRERAAAQGVLQTALDDHRVIMYYQPIVDLATGRVEDFEALARITRHDGSLALPATFIPVAEESGLVVPLGAQALGIACRAARDWPPAPTTDRRYAVAVNISSRQFAAGDLTAFVRHTLEHADLEPSCLHLEITETGIIDLDPDFLAQLRSIATLGVQVGLDDFGTGYASLTHLRRLPLTFVKIDQSFVKGLIADREDQRIVAAVVDLAANLGLRSIAEGVETTEQLEGLRRLGCDQAQGYLFARPLPPADIPGAIAHLAW